MEKVDWKARCKQREAELAVKETEIQEITKHLLLITNSSSAMNNELKKWIEIAEKLVFEIKQLKDKYEPKAVEHGSPN
jgi:hypothetical protein